MKINLFFGLLLKMFISSKNSYQTRLIKSNMKH